MATKLSIYNMALVACGHKPLTTLTDAVPVVPVLALLYDSVRRDLLSRINWPFARKQTIPDAIAYADFGWVATFPYPEDAVLVTAIVPESYNQGSQTAPAEIPWERSQNGLSCNWEEGVIIRYVGDVTDETLFPEEFADLFAATLACRIAPVLTSSLPIVQLVEQRYQRLSQDCMNRAMREDRRRRETGTSLIDARYN